MSESDGSETSSTALKHVWDWFSLHANQRLVTLRFYLALNSAFLAAIGAAYVNSSYLVSLAGSFLSFSITAIFFALDLRTQQQIKVAENALEKLEARLASEVSLPSLELQRISDQPEHKRWGSFRTLFQWLFGIFATVAALSILASAGILLCAAWS